MLSSEKQILVVEDDDDVREALVDALDDRGYPVVVAKNGLEALTMLQSMRARPSVILLDLMMPLMDGSEFLEERRKDPTLATIPVVVLSAGNGLEQDPFDELTRVVQKPIKLSELFAVLQSIQATAAA